MQTTISTIRSFFLRFFTLDDSPHNIAGGAALGIFVGIVPGEGVATAIILAALFKLNKASATFGVLSTNMWATLVFSPIAALVGGIIFQISPSELSANFQQTYHLGLKYFFSKAIFFDLALPLITGFIISAGITSLFFYLIIFYLLKLRKSS